MECTDDVMELELGNVMISPLSSEPTPAPVTFTPQMLTHFHTTHIIYPFQPKRCEYY